MPTLSKYTGLMGQEKARMKSTLDAIISKESALCDVVFRAKSRSSNSWVDIGSNTWFLAAKSEVFAKMFITDRRSLGGDITEPITISDCSAEAIKAMNSVAFNCFDRVKLNKKTVAELMYVAHKYDIQILNDSCEKWLIHNMEQKKSLSWAIVMSNLYRMNMGDKAAAILKRSRVVKDTQVLYELLETSFIASDLHNDLAMEICLLSDMFTKAESKMKLFDSALLLSFNRDCLAKVCELCDIYSSSLLLAKVFDNKELMRSLSQVVLIKCLQSDHLPMTEAAIWRNCVDWAKYNLHQSKTSDDLFLDDEDIKYDETDKDKKDMSACIKSDLDGCGDLLKALTPYIRFTQMDSSFFIKEVSTMGVLDAAEIVAIIQAKNGVATTDFSTCEFEAKPRLISSINFDEYDDSVVSVSVLDTSAMQQVIQVVDSRKMAAVACNKGWSTGKHIWTITIDDMVNNRFGFGVCLNDASGLKALKNHRFPAHPCYLFWGNGNMVSLYQGEVTSIDTGFSVFQPGECITLTLDCERRKLAATNSDGWSKVMKLDEATQYIPCIMENGKNKYKRLTVRFL